MRRSLLVFALLGVVPAGAARCAQVPAPAVVPSAKLLEDVDVLQRVYEQAHPGLYRYNTKAEWDEHLAALRAEFVRDRTLGEAYVALSQCLARIRCGHSYANFYNQPKEVVRALFAGTNRVPFLFRWIGERMVVTRDLTPDGALPAGTEILAIDGHPAAAILGRLMTIARADGGNDAKRVAYLEVRGRDRYEAFDIFLPLFYPGTGERLALDVRRPAAPAPARVDVAALDPASREALGKEAQGPRPGEGEAPWRFETLGDGVAYLNMPGWALYNSKWDWKGFLDRGIDELIDRRAPGLIVDLRDNEGGLDVGNVLIERVASGPIRGGGFRRYTRYRTLPEGLAPYLDTWDWSFKDWGAKATPDRDGFFRMTKFDDDAEGDVIAPRGRRFEGKLVVLVNAANSSATFQFAKLVKDHKLATLVGQPTGGNQRGINGGAFFFATLPNSRIEFDLPLIATFPGDGPLPDGKAPSFRDIPDTGVDPDVLVTPDIADIAAGVDTELRVARALIRDEKP